LRCYEIEEKKRKETVSRQSGFVHDSREQSGCLRGCHQGALRYLRIRSPKSRNVAQEWKDAIPYNADDDRTCSEIMTNKPQTARPERRLMKLPAYIEAAMRVFDQDNRSIQPG
jgi:hypothetical protein